MTREVIMKRQAVVVAIAILVQASLAPIPAEAIPFATSVTGLGQSDPLIQQVQRRAGGGRGHGGGARAGGFHGGGARGGGFHGGGARGGGVRGGGVRVGGVHGGGVRVGGVHGGAVRVGGWSRPGNYFWRPGGAIAAGAAIGFVFPAGAPSWARGAPRPHTRWGYPD